MAHPKRVINFALFFMPVSNSPTVSWRFTPPGQFQTTQDKFGQLENIKSLDPLL